MEEGRLGAQLVEPVAEAIRRDCGELWARALRPFLRPVLRQCVAALKKDIDEVLDLDRVVLTAFVRDKQVLVDLFQRVGAAELDFLVKSGLYLGFLLGVGQAAVWTVVPRPYTLPIAGALVGYVTNWLAIKLLFEPAEPTPVGPVTLQGLFEQRQPEVSAEFALFLSERVLTSPRLLDEMGFDRGLVFCSSDILAHGVLIEAQARGGDPSGMSERSKLRMRSATVTYTQPIRYAYTTKQLQKWRPVS